MFARGGVWCVVDRVVAYCGTTCHGEACHDVACVVFANETFIYTDHMTLL